MRQGPTDSLSSNYQERVLARLHVEPHVTGDVLKFNTVDKTSRCLFRKRSVISEAIPSQYDDLEMLLSTDGPFFAMAMFCYIVAILPCGGFRVGYSKADPAVRWYNGTEQ